MKGAELPINMIVIVAVAVLVLVVTAGFFGGFFASNVGTIGFEQAFNNACSNLKSLYNCAVDNIDQVFVNYQAAGMTKAEPINLGQLCNQKLGRGTVTSTASASITSTGGTNGVKDCVVSCGCPRPA